jgi:predicted permease
MRFRKWLRLLLRDAVKRSRFEGQMDDEIRFHLESRVEDLVRAGLARAEAERRARLEFGGVESHKEDCRQARGLRFLDELRGDLRLALRQMRRTPGFSAVAVLILAIGIGANTAIFSLVDAVLLKMLPVRHPEQLRYLQWTGRRAGFVQSYDGSNSRTPTGETVGTSFSYPVYQYLRDRSEMLDLCGFGGSSNQLNLNIRGRAELARGLVVSGNFFQVLGVDAVLGRTITPEDDRPGGIASVAVLSYGFWERAFGADPAVLGQTVAVNGTPFVIIGVTPKGFSGVNPGRPVDLMVPLAMQPVAYVSPSQLENPRAWWFRVMGRLKPGADPEQARARSEFLLRQAIAAQPPEGEYTPPRLDLIAGGQGLESLRNNFRKPLLVLMAVAGLVLLIVCANVGGLLLTRAAARRKEIGTRLALGAGRARLVRQLLTESLALAALGGGAGVTLAYGLRNFLPELLTRAYEQVTLDITLDARMLLFSTAACLLAGIFFGLAPALRATRVDLVPMLKQGPGQAAARSGGRAGRPLVVVQVALSLVLLAGAGFFLRTVANLGSETLGFRPENLLLFQVNAMLNGYEDDRLADLYERVLHAVEAVPGARSASLSRHGLVSGSLTSSGVQIPGSPSTANGSGSYVHYVAPKYFETMGIPILTGRDIEWHDRQGAAKVAAVNAAFAKEFFEGANPLGRTFSLERGDAVDPIVVIALIGDAKYSDIRDPAPPTVYLPFRQHPQNAMTFAVRAAGEPEALTASLREAVAGVDPNLPLFGVRTQVEQISQATQQERLFAQLLVCFGLLALFLACLGLYGTLSYAVTGRIPEIGLRMALGAQRRDVAAMILKGSLVPVGLGVVIGLVAAAFSTRLIESMLFGVEPNDPWSLGAATLVLMASAAIAAWLPARRASRVDPIRALRYE